MNMNLYTCTTNDHALIKHLCELSKTRIMREPVWNWLVTNLHKAFALKGKPEEKLLQAFECFGVGKGNCFETTFICKNQCNYCSSVTTFTVYAGPVYNYDQVSI